MGIDGAFSYKLKSKPILTRLIIVFCFEKLIEGIITVEGEEFSSSYQEKSFYDLIYDSLEQEKRVFEILINYYSKYIEDARHYYYADLYMEDGFEDNIGTYICTMLTEMRSTLDVELGSVKKCYSNGKYKRYYPK